MGDKTEVFIDDVNGRSDVKVITIKGAIDAVTSPDVDKTVLPVIERGDANIILDLSNVEYLSSTGMMCLIRYLVYSTGRRRIFRLVRPPQNVYDTLMVAGIAKHFNISDTVGDAIERSMKENK
ncbi:MAG: STAS domain-containing protein [Nitrospirota bacterium]